MKVTAGDKIKSSRVSLAEQQQVYREEIDRIWNNQMRSLSNKEAPEWDEEMEESAEAVNLLHDLFTFVE